MTLIDFVNVNTLVVHTTQPKVVVRARRHAPTEQRNESLHVRLAEGLDHFCTRARLYEAHLFVGVPQPHLTRSQVS